MLPPSGSVPGPPEIPTGHLSQSIAMRPVDIRAAVNPVLQVPRSNPAHDALAESHGRGFAGSACATRETRRLPRQGGRAPGFPRTATRRLRPPSRPGFRSIAPFATTSIVATGAVSDANASLASPTKAMPARSGGITVGPYPNVKERTVATAIVRRGSCPRIVPTGYPAAQPARQRTVALKASRFAECRAYRFRKVHHALGKTRNGCLHPVRGEGALGGSPTEMVREKFSPLREALAERASKADGEESDGRDETS